MSAGAGCARGACDRLILARRLRVPAALTAFVSLRLREPVGGQTDDPASAAAAAKEAPVPFAEARRTLFAVPTLRRQFSSFFFIGAGFIPLAFYVPIFLKDAFVTNVKTYSKKALTLKT